MARSCMNLWQRFSPRLIHWFTQTAAKCATPRGPIRRGKFEGIAWKQGGMWTNVNEFPKSKRWKYPQYTSEWGCVMMCKSNRPFIPANDYHPLKSAQWQNHNRWHRFVTTLACAALYVACSYNVWHYVDQGIFAFHGRKWHCYMTLFLLTKGFNVEMKEPHIPCVTQSCSQMQ